MSEQLALVADHADPTAPRCRMCVRPARWLTTQQRFAMYCAGRSCDNRERLCQACGGLFVMNVDGAGTKYCSPACKVAGYRPTPAARGGIRCAWCGTASPDAHRTVRGRWPYICASCTYPIRHVIPRLKDHNVPHERARRLLTDPGCEICGADLLARVRTSSSKVQALLVVDHDHNCCPVTAHSCGACVRGLLCRACNAAAGQLRDNPDNARALAAYLDGWLSGQDTIAEAMARRAAARAAHQSNAGEAS